MREALRRLGLMSSVLGVLGFFAPAYGVTMSFKAVKKNANVISPAASTVAAVPGDTIEIDVYASGWNADIAGSKVSTYQFATNARKGFHNNGGPGFILPKGWNGARDLFMCDSALDCVQAPENAATCSEFGFCTLICNTNADCVAANPAYPSCSDSRHCVGANHVPEMGGFISANRADYIFAAPFVSVSAVNTQSLDYVSGATVIGGGDGASDTGVEKYVGSLILVVAPGACGTYKVGAINNVNLTFVDLFSGGSNQTFAPTISQLTINLPGNCGACCMNEECTIQTQPVCTAGGGTYKGDGTDCDPDPCVACPTVLASNPPKCAIDARYPNSPTAVNPRFGFTSVDVTYSAPLNPAPIPGDFVVTVTPIDPGVAGRPVVTGVQLLPTPPNAANTYRLTLDPTKPPPSRQWTCFAYNSCAPAPTVCVGALPMDADQNRSTAGTVDLTTLINALNGGMGGPNAANLHKFDMDRSGSFTTVDLVGWVDMAVGAGVFPTLIDKSIDLVCPAP